MIHIKELKNKLILIVLYAGILILFWNLGVPCLFKHFFKIPCPGCGMSRALFCVLKGNIVEAFRAHPMFWSMPILFLFFILDSQILKNKVLNWVVLTLIGVGFLMVWILRLC